MKIGIIKEGKVPMDTRVALSPEACKKVLAQYPDVEIKVQKSEHRCYSDNEYSKAGLNLVDDVSDCDILLGIKEVPMNELVSDKIYLFFSHTIKMQEYNRELLNKLMAQNIQMVDYETLVNEKGQRVIAFGRYAGLVGAYNGLRAYGLRQGAYELKPAHQCFDLAEMKEECKNVALDPIKIVITGGGRVAKGAIETMEAAGIKSVSPNELLEKEFDQPVYAQLLSEDYHSKTDGSKFETADFFQNPETYSGNFLPFAEAADMLIAAAYWHPKAPVLFTTEDMRKPAFKLQVIADITCDIEGSIPSTKRPSTIADPFYDYEKEKEELTDAFSDKRNVTVMAVDNLPNELPRDASDSFGAQLIEFVLPNLLDGDKEEMIKRATITKDGDLTERYEYLRDFANGVNVG